jgi:branched-chain amino acid transport system ATP-binding protein
VAHPVWSRDKGAQMTVLAIERLTMRFGGVIAVDDVTLAVQEGEILSVIGPNGAGKTTLFNAVTGVYRPSAGNVSLGGREVAHRGGARDLFYGAIVAGLTGALLTILVHLQAAWDECINALYVYEEPFDWALFLTVLGEYFGEQSWFATWGIGGASAVVAAAAYGVIRYQGMIVPERIVRCGIARTFQNIRLFPSMSALEVVLCGVQLNRGSSRPNQHGTRSGKRQVREALDLLAMVGLAERAEQGATTLSYGDQRRLEIARALATQPRVLLLDEPAAGMNEAESAQLGVLIRRIRDRGVTIVLIEHHMSLVMAISDRVVVMQNGRILAQGTPAEVQANEAVIAAYLGNDLVA